MVQGNKSTEKMAPKPKQKVTRSTSQEDGPQDALVAYAKELKAGAKLEKALAKLKAMAAEPQSTDHKKTRQKTAPTQRPRALKHKRNRQRMA
jgi:hypothetical protein